MSERLLVPAEPTALQDWRTLTSRAVHADADAAMRLTVQGDVLVLTVAPLHPKGLSDTMPLVLGMRMLRLASPSLDGLDVVVEARALLDRFARTDAAAEAGAGIPVPPAEVRVAWAGISPPRGPWQPVGTASAASLRAAADAGIEEIAKGAPEGSGAHAVDALRRRVWARTALEVALETEHPRTGRSDTDDRASTEHTLPVPAGAAFGAHVLGFLPFDGRVPLLRSGVWTRLSLPAGHILVR